VGILNRKGEEGGSIDETTEFGKIISWLGFYTENLWQRSFGEKLINDE
jgi:hypothetical protein